MHRAMMAVSEIGARALRNNCGVAVYPDGARVRYGLCPGSSDLIGWVPVTVTPEMVGQRVAVFLAIETKTADGRRTAKQRNFIRAVRDAGGRAGFATTPEEAVAIAEGRAP